MDKYLILNADDFGYDAETNEAIETLLKSERITSVSLLAPAPAAEDAADRAKRLGVSVGVHLCLTADDAAAGWKSVSGAKSLGGSLNTSSGRRTFRFSACRRIAPCIALIAGAARPPVSRRKKPGVFGKRKGRRRAAHRSNASR